MKVRKNLLLGLIAITFAGCAPIYLPPAAHTPLLKEKKEYQGGLYFGTHGIDIQGAYALTDHIGFMCTGSFSVGGQKANSHAYGEGGLGLFTSSALSRMSVFAGAGYGYASGNTSWDISGNTYEGRATARYVRPFVQTTMAFHTAIFDMGINPRFALLQLDYLDADSEFLPGRVRAAFFEPVGFMGMGFGDFKLKWQLGFSVPLATEAQFNHKSFIFSMGMYFRIRPQKVKLF